MIILLGFSAFTKPVQPPRLGRIPAHIQQNNFPKVFLISEDANLFNVLSGQYPTSLLEAANYDMDKAYAKWMNCLTSFEEYCDKYRLDIKGLKIWIKVFWAADGSIEHIAFQIKPNSRNINPAILLSYMGAFMKVYKLPMKDMPAGKFSHYSSASFPTFYKAKTTP
jgi:hypothetical protein